MGTLINGKELAEKMQAAFLSETATLKDQGVTPGLVVLLVGEDKASQTYVKNKELAAAKIGINSRVARYPESITEAELLAEIEQFNNDDAFHGILVQLPLPKHINEEKVLLAIKPEKDVDGFHPINLGKLFAGVPDRIPCTPYGIMKMFAAYGIELEGKNALVIGRSNIVGKPMAHLLLGANATVTIAHSTTKNLPELAKQGAVVIDVGMNRDANGKLIGDVKFVEVEPIASYITPVPRGVGPMTITMLMAQTIEAAKETMKN